MIDSRFESDFPLLLPDSHLRGRGAVDEATLRRVRTSAVYTGQCEQQQRRQSTCFDVIVGAPFLSMGLGADWNVDVHAESQTTW